MKVNYNIDITANNLPTIMGKLPDAVTEIVEKAAFDCQAEAQNIVPVDTGNLKGSIVAKLENPTTSTTSANADYAGYVEYGTYKMAAQPFMMPAAEIAGAPFIASIKAIIGKLS